MKKDCQESGHSILRPNSRHYMLNGETQCCTFILPGWYQDINQERYKRATIGEWLWFLFPQKRMKFKYLIVCTMYLILSLLRPGSKAQRGVELRAMCGRYSVTQKKKYKSNSIKKVLNYLKINKLIFFRGMVRCVSIF